MKWGSYNEQAAEKVTEVFTKLVSSRVLYVLLALASFVLLSAANNKWT